MWRPMKSDSEKLTLDTVRNFIGRKVTCWNNERMGTLVGRYFKSMSGVDALMVIWEPGFLPEAEKLIRIKLLEGCNEIIDKESYISIYDKWLDMEKTL